MEILLSLVVTVMVIEHSFICFCMLDNFYWVFIINHSINSYSANRLVRICELNSTPTANKNVFFLILSIVLPDLFRIFITVYPRRIWMNRMSSKLSLFTRITQNNIILVSKMEKCPLKTTTDDIKDF